MQNSTQATLTSSLRNYTAWPRGDAREAYLYACGQPKRITHAAEFCGGAVHPLIQTGYAVEFGSDAMVAQALAQTAVHDAFRPELFDLQNAPPP
ncbi:hypothetical protein BD413DRAFT_570764 [Trametes elegans]|nr:hypothetical protein BD413DRAFT_570764 [Trametes elegans]